MYAWLNHVSFRVLAEYVIDVEVDKKSTWIGEWLSDYNCF